MATNTQGRTVSSGSPATSNDANGYHEALDSPTSAASPHTNPVPAPTSKKGKGKKVADPSETSKLLAAKISQLEQDAAGEKDQEQEIGTCARVERRCWRRNFEIVA